MAIVYAKLEADNPYNKLIWKKYEHKKTLVSTCNQESCGGTVASKKMTPVVAVWKATFKLHQLNPWRYLRLQLLDFLCESKEHSSIIGLCFLLHPSVSMNYKEHVYGLEAAYHYQQYIQLIPAIMPLVF